MRRLLLGLFALCAMLIIGCGGAALIDSPEIIMVVMDTASVTIYWEVDTEIEGHADFQGYNVYIATDTATLMVEDGEDLDHINTDVINDSLYTIDGLSQDTVYYIQVRTVNTDDKVGSYNVTVPYIEASPRPVFTATVKFEMNTPGVDIDCAIRLSDATLMADSAMVNGDADLWVDVWPTSTKDTVAFDSPSHSSEWGSGARVTLLANYGQYELDEVYEVTTEPTIDTYVPVEEGDLVVVKTADNNYAKIHVDVVDKTNNEVTITYAYQNIANLPFFGPQR